MSKIKTEYQHSSVYVHIENKASFSIYLPAMLDGEEAAKHIQCLAESIYKLGYQEAIENYPNRG